MLIVMTRDAILVALTLFEIRGSCETVSFNHVPIFYQYSKLCNQFTFVQKKHLGKCYNREVSVVR